MTRRTTTTDPAKEALRAEALIPGRPWTDANGNTLPSCAAWMIGMSICRLTWMPAGFKYQTGAFS